MMGLILLANSACFGKEISQEEVKNIVKQAMEKTDKKRGKILEEVKRESLLPLDILVEKLRSNDKEISEKAARAITFVRNINQKEIIETLEIMAKHTNPAVRCYAATSFSRHYDLTSYFEKTLISLLEDASSDVRSGAAMSLIYCFTPKAFGPLWKTLFDPEINVRLNAALALRYFGFQALPALPTLAEGLNEKSPIFTHNAYWALVEIFLQSLNVAFPVASWLPKFEPASKTPPCGPY